MNKLQKQRALASGIAAACVWLGSTQAQAAGTATVMVTANVAASCLWAANTYSISQTINPLSIATSIFTQVLSYQCTTGQAPTIAASGNGALTGVATASNTIGYTWQTAGAQTGGGAGSTKTVSANVTLDGTQLAAAAADTYAGSFTVTITP